MIQEDYSIIFIDPSGKDAPAVILLPAPIISVKRFDIFYEMMNCVH